MDFPVKLTTTIIYLIMISCVTFIKAMAQVIPNI